MHCAQQLEPTVNWANAPWRTPGSSTPCSNICIRAAAAGGIATIAKAIGAAAVKAVVTMVSGEPLNCSTLHHYIMVSPSLHAPGCSWRQVMPAHAHIAPY